MTAVKPLYNSAQLFNDVTSSTRRFLNRSNYFSACFDFPINLNMVNALVL